MVACLNKSDASEGFNQVIDFLNGTYIKYALTVNPNIYVSCIKQFWNTVVIKLNNDVTGLQALVDKKKVVVTEASIREVLRLDDAEGVDCLPNEEIFTELACMGYEKPSTKLAFYKAFFSSQRKFLIHIIFQSLSAKRKGFIEVETPLFKGMLVEGVIKEGGDAEECVQDVADDDAAQGADTAVQRDDAQEPTIPSPTPPTPPPKPPQDLPSTAHGEETREREKEEDNRLFKDDLVALMDNKEEDKKEEEAKVVEDDQVQGRQAESQAKIYKIDVDHASKVLKVVTAASEIVSAASTIISAAEPQVPAATITAAPEEESRAIQSINETPAQKAAKRRKLNEEVEDLKRHLEIVPDEDDDVYTEATPLARKLILLVERRYPLLRFTLDQMLNAVRLQVEEQSEMSLELLRFTRQQHQEGQLE
nr:xylulose kinase-1 [Tanacetum cinerariifolium]